MTIPPGNFPEWPALPSHPTPGHSTHEESAHKNHLLGEAVLLAPHCADPGVMSTHMLWPVNVPCTYVAEPDTWWYYEPLSIGLSF